MIIRPGRKDSRDGRRSGLISVAVLVALIIIGIVCSGLVRVARARRHEIGREERRLQAAWLVESGIERASARLAESTDYPGETWEIPREDLEGRGLASVQIQVVRQADRLEWKIHVQADYPAGSPLRSRQSKDIVLRITP